MESACREIKPMDKHLKEGLSILARIITKDFIARQSISEDDKHVGKSNENFQNK